MKYTRLYDEIESEEQEESLLEVGVCILGVVVVAIMVCSLIVYFW